MSKVQEGETPSGPKEAAEAPDAEKSLAVLPPFLSVADLSVDHEEHHKARGHQDHRDCHVGEIMGQQGLVVLFHPAPGNTNMHSEGESK